MKRRGPKPRVWRSVEQTVRGWIDHSRSVAAEHKPHGGAGEQGGHVALTTRSSGALVLATANKFEQPNPTKKMFQKTIKWTATAYDGINIDFSLNNHFIDTITIFTARSCNVHFNTVFMSILLLFYLPKNNMSFQGTQLFMHQNSYLMRTTSKDVLDNGHNERRT